MVRTGARSFTAQLGHKHRGLLIASICQRRAANFSRPVFTGIEDYERNELTARARAMERTDGARLIFDIQEYTAGRR